MDDDERDLVDSLRSDMSEGERFQAALLAFYRLLETHRVRLTTLINARSYAARLDPVDVLNRSFSDAVEHLRKQVAGKKSFAFRGDLSFEGWLMSIVGDVRRKRRGGTIPTLLREQDRIRNREESFDEKYDRPDEADDETTILMKSFNLEDRLASLRPTDRLLFELDAGALAGPPSAEAVIAHAHKVGMTQASVAFLTRRAMRMTWRKRKGSKVTRAELAMLFGSSEVTVRKRVCAALLQPRHGLGRDDGQRQDWPVNRRRVSTRRRA